MSAKSLDNQHHADLLTNNLRNYVNEFQEQNDNMTLLDNLLFSTFISTHSGFSKLAVLFWIKTVSI